MRAAKNFMQSPSISFMVPGSIEARPAGVVFGGPTPRMLSDRDVAPQAHTDVLAAVPKTTPAGRAVRRPNNRLLPDSQPDLKDPRLRGDDGVIAG